MLLPKPPSLADRTLCSPEVGELHNQVALLLFMQGNVDDSATHAQHALDVTKAAFGPGSVLTGHRLLRMGAVRMGQGQLSEAAQMMTDAIQVGEHMNGCEDAIRVGEHLSGCENPCVLQTCAHDHGSLLGEKIHGSGEG